MNRREMFQRLAGVSAVVGIPVAASVVDAHEPPALVVVEASGPISQYEGEMLTQYLQAALEDTPFKGTKCFVLADGLRLHFLGRDGRILNQRA